MKKFTKLVLATSVAFSANAMAMQAMDDASLSETTGQDGLTIGIGISKIAIEKLFIHDNDGLAPKGVANEAGFGGTSTAGAIVIRGKTDTAPDAAALANPTTATHGVVIGANYDNNGDYLLASRNLADLVIDSDAGGGNPFINVAAQVSGLDIKVGRIGVTASGVDDPDSIRRGGAGVVNDIISGFDVKTGVINANIQLGAAPQGAMIKMNSVMVGGLEIKNLGILDNSSKNKAVGLVGTTPVTTREAGEIYVESIKIADADSNDLTISQNISVFNDAYVGTTGTQLGKAAHVRIVSNDTGAKDQYIKGIHLGNRETRSSIGDMEVQGLQTFYSPSQGAYTKGAIITISGH
ncbi:putative pilus system protein FilA [Acinetobacter lwoffii]|uniref:putative pilus system protein FilA n=1 Tax=Acinetobacter lwoffii TaxID=28090 RepID=UPI003F92ECBF